MYSALAGLIIASTIGGPVVYRFGPFEFDAASGMHVYLEAYQRYAEALQPLICVRHRLPRRRQGV